MKPTHISSALDKIKSVNMAVKFLAVVSAFLYVQGSPLDDTCYPQVGCFSNKAPWTSDTRQAPPPQHPSNISVSMYYYTPELASGSVLQIFPNVDFKGTMIKSNRPTTVIFHGYGGDPNDAWILSTKDALLRRTGGNVLVMAWGIQKVEYEQAASDARVAGKLAAMTLQAGQLTSNLYLIGHCVGAHIASYTAKALQESGKTVARLTAIDPSGPLFEGQPEETHVAVDDADFVDVLHTDNFYPIYTQPAGNVDFYFSTGVDKPGCLAPESKVFSTCAHSKAYLYFAETIQDDCMKGQPADLVINNNGDIQEVKEVSIDPADGIPVGLSTPISARGIYLVSTNPQQPYCKKAF